MDLKSLPIEIKKNKTFYYLKNYFRYYSPQFFYKKNFSKILQNFETRKDKDYIIRRVNYYNKLSKKYTPGPYAKELSDFYKTESKTVYFFDAWEYLRYFDRNMKIDYVFGDVTHIPDTPSIVKSRPIQGKNENSIVMKLNKKRHFFFIKDPLKFENKKNLLVWRGNAVGKPHRISFLKKYWNHPLCDVGQVHKIKENVPWEKERLSIRDQLDYKFILSLEGNDVATNLKWGMSSNSLIFSPPLKYETWYNEGKLVAGEHLVIIKEDFTDLEDKIQYYLDHHNEAQQIIENAHQYIKQFENREREDIINLLVLKKYFDLQE